MGLLSMQKPKVRKLTLAHFFANNKKRKKPAPALSAA